MIITAGGRAVKRKGRAGVTEVKLGSIVQKGWAEKGTRREQEQGERSGSVGFVFGRVMAGVVLVSGLFIRV